MRFSRFWTAVLGSVREPVDGAHLSGGPNGCNHLFGCVGLSRQWAEPAEVGQRGLGTQDEQNSEIRTGHGGTGHGAGRVTDSMNHAAPSSTGDTFCDTREQG